MTTFFPGLQPSRASAIAVQLAELLAPAGIAPSGLGFTVLAFDVVRLIVRTAATGRE
ncbi:MAG: hypothetical protein NVSMB8_02380 [Candidatus Limnocylindrales bacterium]